MAATTPPAFCTTAFFLPEAMNIQEQIKRNREIIQALPERCTVQPVWCPTILDYTMQVVWQTKDQDKAV